MHNEEDIVFYFISISVQRLGHIYIYIYIYKPQMCNQHIYVSIFTENHLRYRVIYVTKRFRENADGFNKSLLSDHVRWCCIGKNDTIKTRVHVSNYSSNCYCSLSKLKYYDINNIDCKC